MQLLLYFLAIICDNIQINCTEFDTLTVGDKIYKSSDMSRNSRLKISYPGFYIYEIEKIGLKDLILIDKTKYIEKLVVKDFNVIVEEESFSVIRYELIKLSLILANLAILSLLFFRFFLPTVVEEYYKDKLE